MIKPSVYLALPCHDKPEPASTYSALIQATNNDKYVKVVSRKCSLLAHGFNIAWTEFVKDEFDFFAMLHSDVAASPFWVDTLIAELGTRYAVMHAPVAIKDDRTLTSTALGHVDRPFDLCRRITLKELHQLPETFGYAEASREMKCHQDGFALLPNTGCFVVHRHRFPVHLFPGFEIRSMIVNGEAVVESEDWGFGRWCAKHDVQVGSTRKVVTRHFGTVEFSTEKPKEDGWARDYDFDKSGRAVST